MSVLTNKTIRLSLTLYDEYVFVSFQVVDICNFRLFHIGFSCKIQANFI